MVFLIAVPIAGFLVLMLLKANEDGEPETSSAEVVGELYEADWKAEE